MTTPRQYRIPTRRVFPRALTIIGLAILAVASALLLTGCGDNPKINHRIIQLTDDDGCKYFGVVGDMNFPAVVGSYLTPLIGRDGKQICK